MLSTVKTRDDDSAVAEMTAPGRVTCLADQQRLVAALRAAAAGTRSRLIETHISYVLLTGGYAYKIKKAVELGFLDFRTLHARRFFCEQEIRLNRRLAPSLYLDVVAITGSADSPMLGGKGPAIEYAVRMREFPQEALASLALVRGEFSAARVDELAACIATFHHTACMTGPDGSFGAPERVLQTALQNFEQIRALLDGADNMSELNALVAWTQRQYDACKASMERRRNNGFVRECHGDLHLGNIAIVGDKVTIFDCIEFNEQMRWIDVMSEVAFTVMDLRGRGRADFAHRFLNAYLDITGDYDGLSVLRFYLVYRAMVRAKICRMRAQQLEYGEQKNAALTEYRSYVDRAKEYAQSVRPALVITHGLAGSGKTTGSQALLEIIGAVRIRTDVERKRLRGLLPTARKHDGIGHGLYGPESTQQTYVHVMQLARRAIAAGFNVIVDAAFLQRWQRQLFREAASQLSARFVIVSFVADETVLRQRIRQRLQDATEASDADLAVLEYQLCTREPLAPDESAEVVVYNTQASTYEMSPPAACRGVLERLARND